MAYGTSRRAPYQPRASSANARRTFALAELATNAWRPAAELGLLLQSPVFWGWGVPRGDGHPVLVLPGLFAGDAYLEPLRGWLRRVGYAPVRSGLERNPGWSERLVRTLGEIAAQEGERSGRRVTIIGHSMGGLLAHSIAVRRPGSIDQVIALGAPLGMTRERVPERIRVTALYSRADQIVRHPGAQARDPGARNIAVAGSHTGLAFNPDVYRHLGNLLGRMKAD